MRVTSAEGGPVMQTDGNGSSAAGGPSWRIVDEDLSSNVDAYEISIS